MTGSLLDCLAETEHVFISDLRYPQTRQLTLVILKKIANSTQTYPVEEWNYTLEYIYSKSFSFQTQNEVIEFLNNHIGK